VASAAGTVGGLAARAALAGLLLAPLALAGAEVYKGVDEQGNVIYSASPRLGADPERVERVRIDPGPTEADRMAAEQRMQAREPSGDSAVQPADAPQQPEPPPASTAPQHGLPIDLEEEASRQGARTTARKARRAGGIGDQRRASGAAPATSERTSR
jgi:hypothetical protein